MSEDSPVEVVVGRLGKPHGVGGEVSVEVRTDEPDRRFVPGAVLRVRPPRGREFPYEWLTVAGARRHQTVLLVRFVEVADRTAAEGVRGALLESVVDRTERPDDPEEFYDHQVVGLAVHDEQGHALGEVARVQHGPQDLLVVRTPDGHDALVPFVAALVPEVDPGAGRVVVADRPGLVSASDEPDEPDEPHESDGCGEPRIPDDPDEPDRPGEGG